MAKKKNTKAVEPVEEMKIDEVEVVEEVKEECDEKECLDSLKEKICEFYGIRDEELFSKDCDLSKYNLKKQEEATLLEWVEANKKVKSGDVVFDIYTTNTEA